MQTTRSRVESDEFIDKVWPEDCTPYIDIDPKIAELLWTAVEPGSESTPEMAGDLA
jgi:hypothetical protein